MLHSRRRLLILLSALTLTGAAQSTLAADQPQVAFKTSMGEFVMEVYPEKAPKTVANFLEYVKSGHYNGTIFHRVINNFMVQGGGFDKDFNQKPTRAPIQNEAGNGLMNDPYTVAMARTADPHSASAQFFVNVKANNFLNYPARDGWGYAVFGKVIKGTDVIDKIKAVATGPGDRPVNPVIIESASVLK